MSLSIHSPETTERFVTRPGAALLKKRVQTLAAQDDDSMIELAEALAEIWALPKPPEGDRPTLEELIDLTKMSRRTIFYLLKVWRRFRDLGVPRDRLVRIGWTKLAVIAESYDPGTVDAALALAETCVAKELPRRLRGGHDCGKIRTVHLRLTPRQHEDFEAALLANGARRPKNKRGLARKETALMRALRRL
jgi:hypothetical protein